jgi:hypothetical protein
VSGPLAIDLFCGLGGWTDGLLAEGWDVIGFDIEAHVYGEHRYPAQLVIQDVLTLHGSQFASADLIVASPPCQEFSYMAMPWTRARRIAKALRGEGDFPEGYRGSRTVPELTALFDACFRIQQEAREAAGRHIPLVVENVKGAQPWVGRARWNFGSYYLWGDVPALMPATIKAPKNDGGSWFAVSHNQIPHSRGDALGQKTNGAPHIRDGEKSTKRLTNPEEHGQKNPGFRFDGSGKSFQSDSVNRHVEGVKQRGSGHAWFDKALDERRKNPDGRKNPGIELGEVGFNVASAQKFGPMVEGVKYERTAEDRRQHIGAKRKFASAMIAKIPLPLSRHIAATYRPSSHTGREAA